MAVAGNSKGLSGAVASTSTISSSSIPVSSGVPILVWAQGQQATATPVTPTFTTSSSDTAVVPTNNTTTFGPSTDRKRLACAIFVPGSSAARTFTATWSTPQTSYCIGVIELAGADPSGTVVQSNVGLSTSIQTLSVGLSAFGSTSNAALGIFGSTATTTTSAAVGSGFTQVHRKVHANGLFVAEFKSTSDTTVDYTFNSANHCAGIALEIKSLGGGSVVVPVSLSLVVDTPVFTPVGPIWHQRIDGAWYPMRVGN